ncbi:Nuclear pore complex nucleoporin component [Aphanomyces cochlioides]|nr:Nuclear pore complex nucleoporin component [Aphanomyces cochlioides]
MVRVRAPSLTDDDANSHVGVGIAASQINTPSKWLGMSDCIDEPLTVQSVVAHCERGALQLPSKKLSWLSIQDPSELKSKQLDIHEMTTKLHSTTIQDLENTKKSRDDLLSRIAQNVKRLEALTKAIPPPKEETPTPTPLESPAKEPDVPKTIPPSPPTPSPVPAEKSVSEAKPVTVTPSAPMPTPVSKPDSIQQFVNEAKQKIKALEQLQESIKEVIDSKDLTVKKIRIDVKKKLGEACNQIANSPSSIKLVVGKICQVLSEAKVAGELYFKFSLDIVASKFAAQTRVITEVRSCFPLANVLTMCCVHTPELVDVFLAYLYKACPYTIPHEPKKAPDQSIDEYKLSIGMEYEEGSKTFEPHEKYIQRMTMCVALLSSIMQTYPFDGKPQPRGLTLADCWTWIARIVNAEPNVLTSPILLAILETSGYQMFQTYKRQFGKLISLIQNTVVPSLSRDVKSGAAASLARLTTFLAQDEIKKEPEGRRPEETSVTLEDEERDANEGPSSGYSSRNLPPAFSGGRGRGRGRSGGRGYR